ncbi:uncharacterized protein LOC113315308 [Papaver somniferum]|uniref:uncharacterized protein LOC113315308 n=1 Tax=Papaver somniferum TaxID=3469 RepID=UPI000E6FA416|nr:uncharacterized protein LOC113315308 [Papaver somniferum]
MDRFVVSCLKATFTSTISGDVLSLTTSREIWEFLESCFQTQYRARKNMLRAQLFGIKRGNLNILVYLQKIKSITDSLAAIGEKVNDSDLIMHVLNGLGREYDTFIISAQNKDNPYTFSELKARLLTHEQWLFDQDRDTTGIYDSQHNSGLYARNGNSNSGNSYNANGGKKKNGSNFPYGRGNGNKSGQYGSSFSNIQGNYDPGSSSTSTGGSRRFDLSQVDCQICRKKGH